MSTRNILAATLLLAATTFTSEAVIIAGGDGTGNTTGAGVTGWNYVGGINNSSASGTYIGLHNGGYWVLTAYHVAGANGSSLGNFSLGGYDYSFLSGSGQHITDSNNVAGDIFLAQITGSSEALAALAGLENLTLASSTPNTGTDVTMVGYGHSRSTTASTGYLNANNHWSATPSEEFDTPVDFYSWEGPQTKRWGTNQTTATGFAENTHLVLTDFDDDAGYNEAQAASGDSGGGVFYLNGPDTVLSGLMVFVTSYNGQPGNTSAYGNNTAYVDISYYRANILAAVPEPTSAALILLSGVALFGSSRRRIR